MQQHALQGIAYACAGVAVLCELQKKRKAYTKRDNPKWFFLSYACLLLINGRGKRYTPYMSFLNCKLV